MFFIQKKNTEDIFQAVGRILSLADGKVGFSGCAQPSEEPVLRYTSERASGSSGRFSAALEAGPPGGFLIPAPSGNTPLTTPLWGECLNQRLQKPSLSLFLPNPHFALLRAESRGEEGEVLGVTNSPGKLANMQILGHGPGVGRKSLPSFSSSQSCNLFRVPMSSLGLGPGQGARHRADCSWLQML